MDRRVTRRQFMKTAAGAAMGSAGAAAFAAARPTGEPGGKTLPVIRIGGVEVSRLILGSNPFWGFAHQPGNVGKEMQEYFTDERIVQALEAAGEQGVTAVASPPSERWIKLFNEYRRKGGKVRTWIAQPHAPGEKMVEEIKQSVQGGAALVFCQGGRVDEQFGKGTFEVVGEWVKLIKSLGVPAGMASHRPDVHPEAEKRGFATDFYFQCFYNLTQRKEQYLAEDRDKAVETLKKLPKPVIAYKILAAGRLKPEDGFAFAFRHLRDTDAVCVGMYPPHNQEMFRQDADLVRAALAGSRKASRET